MKKLLVCILSLLMILAVCACGSGSISDSNPQGDKSQVGENNDVTASENGRERTSTEELLTGMWVSVDPVYMEDYHSPDIWFIILTTDGYCDIDCYDLTETSLINEMLDDYGDHPTAQDLTGFYHRVDDVVITSIEDLVETGIIYPYEIKDDAVQIVDEGDIEEFTFNSDCTSLTYESEDLEFVKYDPSLGSIDYFVGNWVVNYYDASPDRESYESTKYMLSLNDDLTYISTSGGSKDTWTYMDGKFELSPCYIIDQPNPGTRSITGETYILSDNMFIVYMPYTYKNDITHYYLWTFERAA